VISLAGFALSAPGCVSARDTHAVASAQAQAIGRLAVESAITNAALIRATNALSSIRTERIASNVEAAILSELINPDGSAAHSELDAMLESAGSPSNPLARQVRESLMTSDEAHSWLTTYATALQSPDGANTRRRLLEALRPVVMARTEGAQLTEALRDRARSNALLMADAHASSLALIGASTSDPSLDALVDAAAASWKQLLLENMEDEDQRNATGRLLESILDFTEFTQITPAAAGAAQ
jgi:hypothetical protein